MPVSMMPTCLNSYYVAHLRDDEGFVRSLFDQENDKGTDTTFTWNPKKIDDTVYVSVENYLSKIVSPGCLSGSLNAVVSLKVVHNS